MEENQIIATIRAGLETFSYALNSKIFKTKSRGFHAQGKATISGKRYQVNILLVEIGSKPAVEAKPKAEGQ